MKFKKQVTGILLLLILFLDARAEEKMCLSITGIPGQLLENTQNSLNISPKNPCQNYKEKSDVQKHYIKNINKIKESLQPFGYFKPFIQHQLQKKNHNWVASYHISLGPPLLIHSVQIKVEGPGESNKEINKQVKKVSLKKNMIFDVRDYEKEKESLFKTSKDQGYINAYFQNKIIIDLIKYQADIIIALITGDRYYFGNIVFLKHFYANNFLQRTVTIKENSYFSSKKLMALQQEMENSYFFNKVLIIPDFSATKNHRVPIQIDYDVPKAQRYSLGFGYGTLSGPHLSAQMSLRRLTDNGHHLETTLELSSILTKISANYYIPGNNPLSEEWLIGANLNQFSPKSGDSKAINLMGSYSVKKGKSQIHYNLNYLLERFAVNNNSAQTSHVFYPNLSWHYLNINKTDQQQGLSLVFNAKGTVRQLFSSTSFVQTELRSKYIFSPLSFSKLILRGDLGYTIVKDLNRYPLSLRFLAGGMNSIRGFADGSIGPGRYLYVGSAEYRNRIKGNLSAALFYDIGSAFNHFKEPVNKGAGVGLVYDTLIGPIRVYLARAISKKDRPYSIEFSIGPEFP